MKLVAVVSVIIMTILWIIFFSLLGSIGALLTASMFLLLKASVQKKLIPCLISYATGTLIAAAFLGLIPQALDKNPNIPILSTILVGIIVFFLLEKLVIWRHCHDIDCEVHGVAGPMILIGDAFHNATDGLVIAVSFLFSLPIGLASSISILAHEIPQEIGDFAILVHSGYPKKRALFLNLLSSLSTLPAAILAYFALEIVNFAIPYIMTFSAASFLYIALTDLYPQLHAKQGLKASLLQFLMIIAGIATMLLLLRFEIRI